MRIAFVTMHWARIASSGIGRKMLRQMNCWRSAGHQVTCYMHLHEVQNKSDLLPAEYFFYHSAKNPLAVPVREITRSTALNCLIQKVLADDPDLIYLRWSMYAAPLGKLFHKVPVVVEVNTNDLLEHRLLGFFLNHYNQLTRSISLSGADGLVFTTHELAEDAAYARFTRRRVVVSNGIDLSAYKSLPAPHTKIPHLAFIGTPDLPWQGIEKLVELARDLPDVHIDIIGCDEIPGIAKIPGNLSLHGYLGKAKYEKVLAEATAAIGTLSLYKKGMQEAAPLKIRECAAYGIPLILPYIDTDLNDLKSDAILRIPNTEDNINRSKSRIHDFLYSMMGKRLKRDMLQDLIDINLKEQKRLDFFQTFL